MRFAIFLSLVFAILITVTNLHALDLIPFPRLNQTNGLKTFSYAETLEQEGIRKIRLDYLNMGNGKKELKHTISYNENKKQNKDLLFRDDLAQDEGDEDYHKQFKPDEDMFENELLPYEDDEDSVSNENSYLSILFHKANLITDLFKKKEETTVTKEKAEESATTKTPATDLAPATAETKDESQSKSEISKDQWLTSFMYKPEEIFRMQRAIEDFKITGGTSNVNLNEFDIFAKKAQGDQKLFSPSTYLNSIIFTTDEDWLLWINNKLLTSNDYEQFYQDQMSKITLTKVKQEEVEFELETSGLNTLSPNWQQKLKRRPSGEAISEDGKIRLSKDSNKITFSLKINQTFVLYDMEIVEGVKDPVEIKTETTTTTSQPNLRGEIR